MYCVMQASVPSLYNVIISSRYSVQGEESGGEAV